MRPHANANVDQSPGPFPDLFRPIHESKTPALKNPEKEVALAAYPYVLSIGRWFT